MGTKELAVPPPPAARGTPIPRLHRSGAKIRCGAPAVGLMAKMRRKNYVITKCWWFAHCWWKCCDSWKKSISLFGSIHETWWNPTFSDPFWSHVWLPHLRLAAVPASCGLPDWDPFTYKPGLSTSHFWPAKRRVKPANTRKIVYGWESMSIYLQLFACMIFFDWLYNLKYQQTLTELLILSL